jgi:hypothetical protein
MKTVISAGATFFQAKLAFEIPEAFGVEGRFIREIPPALVGELMRLFPGNAEFNPADVCSPNLLIVDTHAIPAPELVADMKRRIDAVLKVQPVAAKGISR